MLNLIIDAVPARQTGEATGFNALVRSVGSSLGSQVSATILAASAVAGIVTDQGYTDAFVVSPVIAASAGVVALFIPRHGIGARPGTARARCCIAPRRARCLDRGRLRPGRAAPQGLGLAPRET